MIVQLVASIAAVLALATPLAAQDDARARALFLEGRDAYERADYHLAIARFERSFALSGRPTLMRNVARAWSRLGDTERARAALERYLALAPAGPEPISAEQELAELGGPRAVLETPAIMPAVRAPAARVVRQRVAVAPVAADVLAPSLTESAPEPVDEPAFFEGRVWTFVAGATAGVSGLVGGALYLDAYGRYEALAETCGATRNCPEGAISSVETSLVAAEIAFGVAATALVGAIVLYFVEAP